MKKAQFLIIATIIAFLTACGSAEERGFKEGSGELTYKIHSSTGGEKPELLSVLSMEMVYGMKDTVLFDSREMGMPMFLQLVEPEFPGDIYEGLSMLAIGDSATFRVDAEEFFLYTAGVMQLPPFVTPGSKLIFDVKLLKAMNEEEFAEEQSRMMEEQMQADMLRADAEEGIMLAYIQAEGITVAPRESGLYYFEREPGTGSRVSAGDQVAVHYEGRLLDGTVFDSSYERGEPLEFVVGQGQVISGWDEGIGLMRVGEKATLVIPSYLAYGDRGAGQIIQPFSTLVFDVELVDIK